MTNIDRYNSFIADSNNIWLDRFTWKGLDGRSPKNKVSIVNFEKQTGSFAALEPVVNAKSFFNAISKRAARNLIRYRRIRFRIPEFHLHRTRIILLAV